MSPQELAEWRRGWARGCLMILAFLAAFALILWVLDATGLGDIDNVTSYHYLF